MNKIIILLTLFGLVSKSQITFAQTEYIGMATVHLVQSSSPTNCGANQISDSLCYIHYTIFPPISKPNSITYDIFVSGVGSSFPGTITDVGFRGDSTQIAFMKNDADSIVFPFAIHVDHTLHGQISDGCHSYEQYWDYTGIARISITTAGVGLNKNGTLNFELFPNPTNGLLKINSAAYKVTVIDNLGRIIISQELQPLTGVEFSTLDVSSLPSGCYTLLLDEGMKKITTKFIKY